MRGTAEKRPPRTAEKTTAARKRKGHQAGGALRAPPACDVILAAVVFRPFSGAVFRPFPATVYDLFVLIRHAWRSLVTGCFTRRHSKVWYACVFPAKYCDSWKCRPKHGSADQSAFEAGTSVPQRVALHRTSSILLPTKKNTSLSWKTKGRDCL